MSLIPATFLERLNRFVVRVKIEDKTALAYLPNPGRLWELLIPGKTLLLSKSNSARYPYTVIACLKKDYPVLLHTHLTNHYIAWLIEKGRIPGFEKFRVLKKEPRVNRGRLDLLLEKRNSPEKLYLEIKTCTLFGEKLALFPDAETKRGTRHLYELLELKKKGISAGCLFVVMSPEVEYFLPAYHIDFEFTKAFLETFDEIKFEALAIKFSPSLEEIVEIKKLKIPVNFLKEEFRNSGAYLLILQIEKNQSVEVGNLGKIDFREGFYIYVGSGRKNLKERVKRHLRKTKKKRWHIDYLLEKAHLYKTIFIISSDNLECLLARDLSKIADDLIFAFGSSDCKCSSHLFYFKENPLHSESFINILNYYRLEKPAEKIERFFIS